MPSQKQARPQQCLPQHSHKEHGWFCHTPHCLPHCSAIRVCKLPRVQGWGFSQKGSGKENWVVSTSRGNDGGALGSVGMGAIELEYR